jgi:hypothetical protein
MKLVAQGQDFEVERRARAKVRRVWRTERSTDTMAKKRTIAARNFNSATRTDFQ